MEPNHLLCQGLMWAGTDAADPGASANWGYRRHRTLAGESACPTGGHNPGWTTLAGESACPTGGHNPGWTTLAGESACPTGGTIRAGERWQAKAPAPLIGVRPGHWGNPSGDSRGGNDHRS